MGEIETAKTAWRLISDKMASEIEGVEHGKMMSAEALTYGGKVFVFFSLKGGGVGLGCRLGRDYPFAELGLDEIRHLAPFKTKPPMKDWILINFNDADRWQELAEIALNIAKNNGRK